MTTKTTTKMSTTQDVSSAAEDMRSSGRKRQRLPPPAFLMKNFSEDVDNTALFCTVITDSDDDNTSATTTTSTASSTSSSSSSSTTNGEAEVTESNNVPVWKDKLLQFSSWASLLCVLDCTILPLCTMLLPVLGIVAQDATQQEQEHHHHNGDWLHELGHTMALYFVVPVGTMAIVMNFVGGSHTGNTDAANTKKDQGTKLGIAVLGFAGLLLVSLANSGGESCHQHNQTHHHSENEHHHDHDHHHDDQEHHHHHHHHHHHDDEDSHNWVPLLLAMVQNFAVLVRQPGMVHRATNLTGCFLMMTSNYLAKKRNHSITAIGDNNKDSSGNNNNADNNTNDNSERKGACWDPGCFCFAGYVSSRNWQKHAWKNNMMGL